MTKRNSTASTLDGRQALGAAGAASHSPPFSSTLATTRNWTSWVGPWPSLPLTILSMLSAQQGVLTHWWITLLKGAFGGDAMPFGFLRSAQSLADTP